MRSDDFVNLAKTDPLCAEKKIIAMLIKQCTKLRYLRLIGNIFHTKNIEKALAYFLLVLWRFRT